MIDRRKNVCYVIEVPYEVEGSRSCFVDYKYQKFLSLHQAHTKHFENFRDKYFTEILNIPLSRIGEWDKDGTITASQETISRQAWKDETTRKRVLEGITEREKCR